MKRNFSCKGIVLQVGRVGERDRFLRILTPDRGILQASAFGAAMPKSKLRSACQVFFSGELYLYENPIKNYITLRDFDVVEEFSNIVQCIKKLYAASICSEIILAMHKVADQQVYRLYHRFLSTLHSIHPQEPLQMLRLLNIALWKLLEYSGDQPDLGIDVLSNQTLIDRDNTPVNLVFLSSEGGFTSDDGELAGHRLEAPECKFLLGLTEREGSDNLAYPLPESAERRIFALLRCIYEYNLGRSMKSITAGIFP